MQLQSEHYQHLARDTEAIAQQVVASGELQGHAGIVRVPRDALPAFFHKHWTTTCFVASGRITLVHVGAKDGSFRDHPSLDVAADELESALAMKYPFWSEGWLANLRRDWWAYKHSMRWIGQRNYYQAHKAGQGRSDEHKKNDNAQDASPLDVSSWPGRWAVLRIVAQ